MSNFFGDKKPSKMKCCVPSCEDKYSGRFRFPNPKDSEMFKLWLVSINNPLLNSLSYDEIYKKYRVCAKHFPEEDLTPECRKGVLRDSVPMFYVPDSTFFNGPIQNQNMEQSNNEQRKNKKFGRRFRGRVTTLVKIISREDSTSEKDRNIICSSSDSNKTSSSSEENQTKLKYEFKEYFDDAKREDVPKIHYGYRIEELKVEAKQTHFLSKSETCLNQTSSEFTRHASEIDLSKQVLRNNRMWHSSSNLLETPKNIPKKGKVLIKNKCDRARLSPVTTDTESDDVELTIPKPLNFKQVITKRVRGSIRLVKGIRPKTPKSDSDAHYKEKRSTSKKNTLFKQMTRIILNNHQPLATLYLQPPAPLVVEDPPSTDDEGLHDLKSQNPAFLNGSSGNFGSAGPRSAPATPQGQLGAPPGGLPEPLASPTIQRSPSHSVFSKVDNMSVLFKNTKSGILKTVSFSNILTQNGGKSSSVFYAQREALVDDDSSSFGSNESLERTNLKHLSTSTPAMTAQGQLAEPPSPKATKDPKVHTTSKARQKKFLRHFPNVEEDEKVLNHYSCALIGDILLQGHLYITKNYFAFYSNVFGYVTKLLIPILTVEEITKEKTARIIPNAVGITTSEDKHIFGSLMSRDSTLAYMRTVWEKAKKEEALPEPEITELDQDSSESGESGRDTPPLESVPSGQDVLASAKFDRMRKESVRNQIEDSLLERKGSMGFVRTLKDAITEFRKLPRQSLILVATTLLLILLFLSAAVLLYRINKIQNKYSISLQGASLSSTSEDLYSDLLQWQTHLHSRSADAVNSFLDNNLDQIAKVRQSLEALSTLLTGQNLNPSQENKTPPSETENSETKAEPVPVQVSNS